MRFEESTWEQVLFEIFALKFIKYRLTPIAQTEAATCFFCYVREEISSRYDNLSSSLFLAVISVPAWFSPAMVAAFFEAARSGL